VSGQSLTMNYKLLIFIFLLLLIPASAYIYKNECKESEKIVSVKLNPQSDSIRFYYKDKSGNLYRSINNLKFDVEQKDEGLRFAMNGGMYMQDNSPQGLFIQDHRIVKSLNTDIGYGNFYLKPNGIFYLMNDNKPALCKTEDFRFSTSIRYATQSGPMLVIDGKINPVFNIQSTSLYIRNGVGLLPDNKVIFAISKQKINFYEFASFFKQAGCTQALYLDGYVSRMYLPEKNWIQTDGDFGVIIGCVH